MIFTGKRTRSGCIVQMDGRDLAPARSLKCRNHSPCGFEWGYCGSGPAQLALAILLEVTHIETALEEYQNFKFEVVCHFGDEWTLEEEQIRRWLTRDLLFT